ncbi:MAG TPA: response regulator, partial [Hymenobacter sp.]
MTILLIEDEALAARKLSTLIRAYNPAYHILTTLESVADAVAWLNCYPHPDLIFLDIHLADGNGFDIFERTPVHAPVIFTTAYDHYALRAFDLNSVHYVLKPVTREGIERGFTKLATLQ